MTHSERELHQFFAGYFHEDWPIDAADPDEVISVFLRDEHPPGELARLADLIDSYAGDHVDDSALEQSLFKELGCYYVPSADGISANAWLRHISTRLRAASRSQ